jgi:hypothetical protein
MTKARILALLLALPFSFSQASSLVMISDSVSASLTESSGSISDSSRSSRRAVANAAGDYKVIEMADAADHPGQQRVQLQSVDTAKPGLYLYLAKAELDQAHLQPGQLVTAQERSYGLAFTRQGGNDAFAVVLDEDARKELAPNPVTL